MKIAASLALKWLGGIAAVGGAGGGLLALHKNGYLSGGGKKDKNVSQEVQPGAAAAKTSQGATSRDNASGKLPDQQGKVDVHNDKVAEEDELGLPKECETNGECDLDTEDKFKKVKFQALGEGNDPVKLVDPLSKGEKISVTIEGNGDNKRYVFKNESNEITLEGSSGTLEFPLGKTRFIEEGKKLKKLETDNYGLPNFCVTTCHLTSSDLSTINFSDFTGEVLYSQIKSEGLDREKTITLTIKDGKYTFNSPSAVSIKSTGGSSGSITVQLDQGETKFKVDSGKLKMIEPWEFGLPDDCKVVTDSEPKTCSLSSRDLEKIKFKDMDTVTSISGLEGDEKVSLEIKKANDSSYPDGRKYIFTPQGSSDVTIKGNPNQSIVLSKTGDNIFKKERGFEEVLVAIPKRTPPSDDVKGLDRKIENLGLPSSCTFTEKASGTEKSIECELSFEELKNLKFSVGDLSTVSGGHGEENNFYDTDPKTYKIKIEEPTENEDQFKDQNIRITFLNEGVDYWSNNLVIIGTDSNDITIANQTNTEFKINDQKQLELAWGETTLSDKVGLKCPKETGVESCTLKENDGSIKVLIDEEEKDFKPTNTSDIENNMTFLSNQAGFNQGIKIELSAEIGGTNGSEDTTLEKGSYEIKRIKDKGWRLVEKEEND